MQADVAAENRLQRAMRYRVNLFILIPIAAILLPNMGLVYLAIWPDQRAFPVGDFTVIPLILYSVFSVASLCTYLFFARQGWFDPGTTGTRTLKRLPNSFAVGLAALLLVGVLTQVDVFALANGDIYKGDLRVDGQILSIIVKFAVPSIFAYVCLAYRFDDQLSLRVVVIVGLIAFVSGGMIGTKTTSVMVLLPGILVLFWKGVRVYILTIGGAIGALIMLASATVFDTRGDVGAAAQYLWQRLSLLTAEMPYRVVQSLKNESLSIDYIETTYGMVTNFVLRRVLDDPDLLYRYNFSTAISAALYPERIPLINSGEWNHTPPIFVEGVIALGPLYILFAFLTAALGVGLFTLIKKALQKGDHFLASVLLTYFVFVFVSWINSAGISGLIHPFPLVALGLTWAMLHICAAISHAFSR